MVTNYMEVIFPAAVALLVQFVKQNSFFDNEWKTLALVVVLSLVGAFGYTELVSAGYWQSFTGILVMAGAIYTYIIARFE